MASVTTYKCPCCGAGIEFDSAKQLFKCEFCLSEFTEEQINAQTPKETKQECREDERENEEFCENLLNYTCDNCGAEVFADENTVADFCYYCHNPIVCKGRLSGQLQPHKIIPFAYDKKGAVEKFLSFAKKKKFVPKNFFSEKQIEKISGVYYPFWLTDVDLNANCSAKAENVRVWTTGKKQYTETSHYALFRAGKIHYEDISTSAYSEENKKMLEGILPFPSEALKDFSMTYLSGFLAKKRNIDKESVEGEVKSRINNYSSQLLTSTMEGYGSVTPTGTNTFIDKMTWDYALMPIWVLTYVKKNKIYTYAMNGHTGKIYGELPISGLKLLILFLCITFGVALLGTIAGAVLL